MDKPLVKPASQCPQLTELADACNNGACNPSGLILSLAKAIGEIGTWQIKSHPAIKCILGQLSYLCDESTGPSVAAVEQYERWKQWSAGDRKLTFEQAEALHTQKQRWTEMGEPQPTIGCDGAVAVQVPGMVLCVERDGLVHS